MVRGGKVRRSLKGIGEGGLGRRGFLLVFSGLKGIRKSRRSCWVGERGREN